MMSVQIPRANIIRVFVTHVNRRSLCTNRVSIGQLFESTETTFPFAESRTGNFFQTRPVLGNQYLEDCTLQSYLKRHLPNNIFLKVEEDLTRFGLRISTEIRDLGHQCEQEQPYIQHYDAWGKRVDRLVTCPSWKRLHDISAEEGIIATAYERENGEFSRLYQMAKVYLFAPVSGLYSCPIAMTDGAAKIIQTLRNLYPWLKERAFYHLTSRKPEEFWTSGQWMTERQGGSDVANGTETLAVPKSDGSYKLYGYKWFSSATDADMAFTLARVVDSQGNTIQGTRGLSLFYLEVKDQDGNLNNIRIQKLKNKLGTRQLPTAELLLHGTTAYKVSEEGRGIAVISNMLKLSRLHTSMMAVGAMRSMCNLARDYSTRRQAFGNTLKNYPLHIQTLCRMEVETRVATLLTMEGARLLGREDVGTASENDQMLLRLLTPLTKLYTAKQAMTVVSEGLESFGGQGYIEDTGLPGTLRDAQVLPIWEGTTNILSLDVLRAIAKTQGAALKVWQSDILTRISRSRDVTDLQACTQQVEQSANRIMAFVSKNQDVLETAARDFAYSLTKTFAGALLIEHAFEAGMNKTDVYTAQRWCNQDLCPVVTNHRNQHYSTCSTDLDLRLVFDGYHDQSQL